MRYVEGLNTIPDTEPDNALILGTALHTGIEEGVEKALDFYQSSFPILTDDHVNEMMKLEAMIPKAKALLPPGGAFELPIGNADFIGFMDYLWPAGWMNTRHPSNYWGEDVQVFDLYDFKYSNNAKSYAVSGQLHEYKYWYELTHPGHRIRNMYFLIVPKVKIRQKKTETIQQFRDRLQDALKDAEPSLLPVQYDPMKIVDFLTGTKHMVEATDFPKNPNHFCGWCEYQEYCEKGWDYMLLPKNERRNLNATKKKVVWLYGTAVTNEGGVLMWNGKPVCATTSQDAFDFFSQNDDGRGRERGELVSAILIKLAKQDQQKEWWGRVWEDPLCRKYKRPEHEDFWIWNYDFYNAPVEDLRYILKLVEG